MTLLALFATFSVVYADQPFVEVSKDKTGFVLTGKAFVPWGFNYDHDDKGRLIEDYWDAEWVTIDSDFTEMKNLGASVVRVHLQFGKFMEAIDRPNKHSLAKLAKLLELAERENIYLDLTGLGCYHKADVPAWYDKLTEADRWRAQAEFWKAIARTCAKSPAVFCYDLMNEPVVPGGRRKEADWLGPPFAGKHFVQFITLDQKDRPRPDIAREWISYLVKAIRQEDPRHLITVGLVDWSLDRKGLTSGFVPEKVTGDLDFLAVHIYPETAKLKEAAETLKGFQIGKPLIVEETFPLKCSAKDLNAFIAANPANGWISFYWGKPPEELRKSKQIGDAILVQWLDLFSKRGP